MLPQTAQIQNRALPLQGMFREMDDLKQKLQSPADRTPDEIDKLQQRYGVLLETVCRYGVWKIARIFFFTPNHFFGFFRFESFKRDSCFAYMNRMAWDEFKEKRWLAELPDGNYIGTFHLSGAAAKHRSNLRFWWKITIDASGRKSFVEKKNMTHEKKKYEWKIINQW